MTHVLLIDPVAFKLWRQFAHFAGIKVDNTQLQKMIILWWINESESKLNKIFRVVPAIIMWTI